jgi:hypothetical protein
MKQSFVYFALLALGLGGLALLAEFPAGYGAEGVFRDFSSPKSALKSYLSAVFKVDENREIATASRNLRYRANRYRGWDVGMRKEGLAGKRNLYRTYRFSICSRYTWGFRGQIVVDQTTRSGTVLPHTYSFVVEDGNWRISDMGAGELMDR